MTDRCNKPLPGGRFACNRLKSHDGQCVSSVFAEAFDNADATCRELDRISEEKARLAERDRAMRALDAWANPPTGGMGSGVHCEMWPNLNPAARKELQRLVKMLKGEKNDD